ncbi:HEAT repeat domain-containing protein [Actinosynnema sp. NPDC049800]
MWAELERVGWAELEHNYGDAADVPQLLRGCADPDAGTAGRALARLYDNLYHQGGWICSAATAALPFLTRLAGRAATHHRPEVVELIGRLAREAFEVLPRFLDAGWSSALDEARPRLLDLLADPDPLVRREATVLVADGIRHPDAVAALRRRWQVEADRVTRWDLVQAFGVVCAREESDAPLRAELTRLLTDDDLQVRLAAVHALAESEPAVAVPHLEALARAVVHPDAALWQGSAWIGDIVPNTGDLLRVDPVAATAYALAVHRGGDTEQRVAAVKEAGRVLGEWRTVTGAIVPFLAAQLDHDEAELRFRSAFLLGCVGAEATDHADRLAALAADPTWHDSRRQVTVGDAAVFALARQRDPRCVPTLVERLTGPRLGFGTAGAYFRRGLPLVTLPAAHEVLVPLREHAVRLVDAVVARLSDPDADPALLMNLCGVVEGWGAAAEAAAPALVPLLGRPDVLPAAAKALGALGPAAAGFADPLRGEADRPEVAWALWRTGLDPEALLRHVTERPDVRHTTVRLVADLGPLAAPFTDRLRELSRSDDHWTRVEAAHALWRVTGDPTEAVAALTDLARPLADGRCEPVQASALRYLADIGSPTAPVVALARAVADNPRRLAYFGGWHTFAEDEAVREAADDLLRSG